jgi:hypothetical protein
VLVDPARAAALLASDADPQLAYLFRNQLAEADLVLYTKSDLYPDALELPGTAARRVSAQSGQGVDAWLDEILGGRVPAGTRLVDIDYALYAAAEAALGWLNWEADLRLESAVTPAALVGPWLERLDAELAGAGAAITHLKIFDRASTGYIKAAICGNGEEPAVEGDLMASPAGQHELTLNLRAPAAPEVLEGALDRTVAWANDEFGATSRILNRQAFRPSPPVPEHRFREVVP